MEVINTGSGEGLGTRLLGPEKVFLVTLPHCFSFAFHLTQRGCQRCGFVYGWKLGYETSFHD